MKKKKIMIGMVALLLCFAGAVQAASKNGDYKGNPIVKVLFGGKELSVEDMPGIIQDGRTLVPLYLLKQTGASVNWDGDKYAVDISYPSSNPTKDFAATIPALNEKAKASSGKNVQLIYNEFGPYLKVDLEMANDTKTDNDHILALSQLILNSPAEVLIVGVVQKNMVMRYITVKRSDAEAFSQKKLSAYDFFRTWTAQTTMVQTDVMMPNRPQQAQATIPSSAPGGGPFCQQITANYDKQMRDAVERHNANPNSQYDGIDETLKQLKENMDTSLKENYCQIN
jgi:hypothetical protein